MRTRALRKIELFAGDGGGIQAGLLQGHKTVLACEIEPYAHAVLAARQADGCLPKFAVHPDVTTLDATYLAGKVDLVCGGFPCQDISAAGRGRGLIGPKSRLVWEMLRVADECRAQYLFAENSDRLRTKGLRQILLSLYERGYDRIAWVTLGASHVGAPHLRKRMWLLARRSGGRQAPLSLPGELQANGSVLHGAVHSFKGAKTDNAPLPTLIASDAQGSGNRPDPTLWSLSDVLGITSKHTRHGKLYPTPVRSDFKGHSGAGMERLMELRSRPLRDVLPYEEGGTCINPEWAEWLMGWAPGWTDPTTPCESVPEWRELTMGGKWWTDAVEERVLPRTLAKRPPGYQDRIKALGNGQVPLCNVAADAPKPCLYCGAVMFRPKKMAFSMWESRRYCSHKCAGRHKPGDRVEYRRVKEGKKRRPLHRVLMEEYLGRALAAGEYVHHKNGDKHDNRIENLEVMSSLAHGRLHHLRLPLSKPCVVCGAVFTPHKTKRRRQQTCGPECKSALLSRLNQARLLG